ncbi:MAG: ABC transporter permease, partial [Egibacteraceae bacterium]
MNTLAGTGALIRLALRRDRIVLPLWVSLLAAAPIGYAASTPQLYPTPQLLQSFADQMAANPAIRALVGPVFAPTIGGLAAWRWGVNAVLLTGVASMLTVIRHTRTEEQAGRRELVSSTAVGRHAALSAALAVTVGADLMVGALVTCGLIGLGLPVAGSVALGLIMAAGGGLFAAAAGAAAQLTPSTRTAKGIVGAVLALSYLVRAVGDGSGRHELSWLSPIGWGQRIQPFVGERWWVLTLFAGTGLAFAASAYALSSRRDLGAGLLPPRLGPATASPGLCSPLALSWRLHRGTLLAWT